MKFKPLTLSPAWRAALEKLTAPLARRQASISKMWQGLSSRERTQMRWLLVLLVLAVAYLVVLAPALKNIHYWKAELPRLQAQSQELQHLLQQTPSAANAHTSSPHDVEASLHAHTQLPPYQITYQAPLLILEFSPTTNAEPLLAWLLHAPSKLGWHTQEVLLQRGDDMATPSVHVTLTLKETSGK